MPPKFGGTPNKFGGQKNVTFLTIFSRLPHSTLHIYGTKRRIDKPKMLVSIYNVFPTRWSTFRDLWSRNGSDPLPHCDSSYENSAFSGIAGTPGFPHKGHWNKANQILPHIRRLKGLTIHRKISGKFVPIFFVSIDERPAMGSQPKIWGAKNIKFWITYSATSALDTAYLWNETKHGQTKMLVSIYNVSSVRWPTSRNLWLRNGWHNIRRPLRCNHQSCNISSCMIYFLCWSGFGMLLFVKPQSSRRNSRPRCDRTRRAPSAVHPRAGLEVSICRTHCTAERVSQHCYA